MCQCFNFKFARSNFCYVSIHFVICDINLCMATSVLRPINVNLGSYTGGAVIDVRYEKPKQTQTSGETILFNIVNCLFSFNLNTTKYASYVIKSIGIRHFLDFRKKQLPYCLFFLVWSLIPFLTFYLNYKLTATHLQLLVINIMTDTSPLASSILRFRVVTVLKPENPYARPPSRPSNAHTPASYRSSNYNHSLPYASFFTSPSIIISCVSPPRVFRAAFVLQLLFCFLESSQSRYCYD